MTRFVLAFLTAFLSSATLLAQQDPMVLDSNTVALWHFDEGLGDVLHDASEYHNDGQIHNAEWVAGRFGQALKFNGATSYVRLPNSASLRMTNEFTLEAWIAIDTTLFSDEPTPSGKQLSILDNLGPYPNGGGMTLFLDQPTLNLQFAYRAPFGISNFSRVVPLPRTSEFHHVAVSYEQLDISEVLVMMFVDGEMKDSVILYSPIQYDAAPYFYIGSNADGRALGGGGIREFAGIIDEVRISKITRRPAEFGLAELSASRSHVSFGLVTVSESAIQEINLLNSSFTKTLHIDSITITDAHFAADQSPFVLAPLSSRPLTITYLPTAAQLDEGTMTFHVSDSGASPLVIGLDGRGFASGASPVLKTVLDVSGDQGRQVRLRWFASLYDSPSESLLVNEYSVWRRVDDVLRSRAASQADAAAPRTMLVNGELWDFITVLPAVRFDEYAYVAPTLVNASQSNLHWSVFRVAGHATNGDFFFSDPDSGYSYDNNFPPPPPSLLATVLGSAISLTWNPSTAPDVEAYNVYRATSPNVVPSVFFRIATTAKAAFEDSTLAADSVYYYTVTAVDSSGNEGQPSNRTSGVTLLDVRDEPSGIPAAFTLRQNYPNPFNPATAITYGVPSASRVRVSVYDLLGRMVATLADGVVEPGYHTVQWTADAASGVYFYRVDATSLSRPAESVHRTGKMLLMR